MTKLLKAHARRLWHLRIWRSWTFIESGHISLNEEHPAPHHLIVNSTQELIVKPFDAALLANDCNSLSYCFTTHSQPVSHPAISNHVGMVFVAHLLHMQLVCHRPTRAALVCFEQITIQAVKTTMKKKKKKQKKLSRACIVTDMHTLCLMIIFKSLLPCTSSSARCIQEHGYVNICKNAP